MLGNKKTTIIFVVLFCIVTVMIIFLCMKNKTGQKGGGYLEAKVVSVEEKYIVVKPVDMASKMRLGEKIKVNISALSNESIRDFTDVKETLKISYNEESIKIENGINIIETTFLITYKEEKTESVVIEVNEIGDDYVTGLPENKDFAQTYGESIRFRVDSMALEGNVHKGDKIKIIFDKRYAIKENVWFFYNIESVEKCN